jgi:putative phosphoribosyl transferase
MSQFRNRAHAGQLLARALLHHADRPDVVVLGLPPGGVPVASEIAACLHAPLDVFVVRPLEIAERGGVALGTLASGGIRVLEPHRVARLHLSKASIESASLDEWNEVVRLERSYRGDRRQIPVLGSTAILVDDGMTPDAALRTAVLALRKQRPERVVVAVPALASATCDALATLADEIVCAATPAPYFWDGSRYDERAEITEEQVRGLIDEANREAAGVSIARPI